MFKFLRLTLAAAILAWAAPVWADDSALYDPAPPPNSAFVRVIDARGKGEMQASVGEVAVTVPKSGISPYIVVPAGEQPVALSTDAGKVTLAAGKYYTIAFFVAGSPEPKLIEDELLTNPAKSGVYVYNFSDAATIALFAPQPKANVIGDLAPGLSAFRSVNAVTVDLALLAGSETVATFEKVALKRRSGMTFVVFGAAGARSGVAVANETAR